MAPKSSRRTKPHADSSGTSTSQEGPSGSLKKPGADETGYVANRELPPNSLEHDLVIVSDDGQGGPIKAAKELKGKPPTLVQKGPFVADAEPETSKFIWPQQIPRLPDPSGEERFYDQWKYRARVSNLPLAGDVDFLVGWNNGTGGNCYWAAIAQIIYGRPEYWPWIKAQHHLWIIEVLKNHQPSRYKSYHRLAHHNTPSANGTDTTVLQRLKTPSAWTPMSMTQVTVDLYNIYLVVFEMEDEDGTKRRRPIWSVGSRNAPHKFIAFVNQNHFEPMRPDVPRPSEYLFPEITVQSTLGIPGCPSRANIAPVRHPWRRNIYHFHDEEEVPEQLVPSPTLPLPSQWELARTIGRYQGLGFDQAPGYTPPLEVMPRDSKDDSDTILSRLSTMYNSMARDHLWAEVWARKLVTDPKINDAITKPDAIDILLREDAKALAEKAPIELEEEEEDAEAKEGDAYLYWTLRDMKAELVRRGRQDFSGKNKAQCLAELIKLDKEAEAKGKAIGGDSDSDKGPGPSKKRKRNEW